MLRKLMLFAACGLIAAAFTAAPAAAKDEVLLQEMVNLEKAYIPPLFFTNQPEKLPAAKKGMMLLRSRWNGFKQAYYDYRADYVNWQAHFDAIEYAIQDAEAVVASVTPENPNTLVLAHEALEGVRATMLDLRPQNGFPKFITDKLTIYHDPMERIVIQLMTQPWSPALLEEVEATFVEAEKAWSEVEKCPVDPGMWGFSTEQMLLYYDLVARERAALDNLAAALATADPMAVKMAGTAALKKPFVDVYTFFGDFAPFQPAPQ